VLKNIHRRDACDTFPPLIKNPAHIYWASEERYTLMKKIFCLIPLLAALAAQAQEAPYPCHTNPHAPVGVMGDHTHPPGAWMTSYRFMRMDMDGNRNGTRRVSPSDVLDNFMVSPLNMTMDMHMVSVMYAPSENATLMLMLPFLDISMDHRTRMGGEFTTESSGLGDIKASALVPLWKNEHARVHLGLGLSLPTGSIDVEDDTPAGRTVLPYPMQRGSGTFDIHPSITAVSHHDQVSFGAQASGAFRIDENDEDYTLGNRHALTSWVQLKLAKAIRLTTRLDYQSWEHIDGADPRLHPMMVPTANPNLRGGERLDWLFGLNLMVSEGPLAGQRLAIEYGIPVHQDLDGPQLETDSVLTLGWQKAW